MAGFADWKGHYRFGDLVWETYHEMTAENSSLPDPDKMPGGSLAKRKGCTCPVLDNHYGRGIDKDGETLYYFSEDCPIHVLMPEESDGRSSGEPGPG